jgi:hypothetical protein
MAEPMVLFLCCFFFQRIKIRCYNMNRGYATELLKKQC